MDSIRGYIGLAANGTLEISGYYGQKDGLSVTMLENGWLGMYKTLNDAEALDIYGRLQEYLNGKALLQRDTIQAPLTAVTVDSGHPLLTPISLVPEDQQQERIQTRIFPTVQESMDHMADYDYHAHANDKDREMWNSLKPASPDDQADGFVHLPEGSY